MKVERRCFLLRTQLVDENCYLRTFLADDPLDEADVSEAVTLRTEPVAGIRTPNLGQPDQDTLALGQRLYAEQACLSCHGETGTGDPLQPPVGDAGLAPPSGLMD